MDKKALDDMHLIGEVEEKIFFFTCRARANQLTTSHAFSAATFASPRRLRPSMIILIRQNPKHNAREVVLTLFAPTMPYHGAMVHDDSSQQLFSRRRFTVPSTSIPQTVPHPILIFLTKS